MHLHCERSRQSCRPFPRRSRAVRPRSASGLPSACACAICAGNLATLPGATSDNRARGGGAFVAFGRYHATARPPFRSCACAASQRQRAERHHGRQRGHTDADAQAAEHRQDQPGAAQVRLHRAVRGAGHAHHVQGACLRATPGVRGPFGRVGPRWSGACRGNQSHTAQRGAASGAHCTHRGPGVAVGRGAGRSARSPRVCVPPGGCTVPGLESPAGGVRRAAAQAARWSTQRARGAQFLRQPRTFTTRASRCRR